MPFTLKLVVVSARNLPVMDARTLNADAFVEIKFNDATPRRTHPQFETLDPQWNSNFKFEVANDAVLLDQPAELRVWDRDVVSANDVIGTVYLDLTPLLVPLPKRLGGWFPIYDTLRGVRGELQVEAKLNVIRNTNPFSDTSTSVRFFACSLPDPKCMKVTSVIGLVDELLVEDDPEHYWADTFRTSRTSNEARQLLLIRLSGRLRRQIGLKVSSLGGNAVLGYHQHIDLEREVYIVARGYGTAAIVKSVNYLFDLDSKARSPSSMNNVSAGLSLGTNTSIATPAISCSSSLPISPASNVIAQTEIVQPEQSSSIYTSAPPSSLPGNSLRGAPNQTTPESGVGHVDVPSGTIPLLTLVDFEPGAIRHYGGVVAARLVKMFKKEKYTFTRDRWWGEAREEIRSHARALHCTHVIGYRESVVIHEEEEICVISAIGTAVVMVKRPNAEQHIHKKSCSLWHIPHEELLAAPLTSKCGICQQKRVPEIILSTTELPSQTPIVGTGKFLEAKICREKRKAEGDQSTVDMREDLPFLEYDLHKQIVHKLHFYGMNAVFRLQIDISIGSNMLTGVASGTAVCLVALPIPGPLILRCSSKECDVFSKLREIENMSIHSIGFLSKLVARQRELYQIPPKIISAPSPNPPSSPIMSKKSSRKKNLPSLSLPPAPQATSVEYLSKSPHTPLQLVSLQPDSPSEKRAQSRTLKSDTITPRATINPILVDLPGKEKRHKPEKGQVEEPLSPGPLPCLPDKIKHSSKLPSSRHSPSLPPSVVPLSPDQNSVKPVTEGKVKLNFEQYLSDASATYDAQEIGIKKHDKLLRYKTQSLEQVEGRREEGRDQREEPLAPDHREKKKREKEKKHHKEKDVDDLDGGTHNDRGKGRKHKDGEDLEEKNKLNKDSAEEIERVKIKIRTEDNRRDRTELETQGSEPVKHKHDGEEFPSLDFEHPSTQSSHGITKQTHIHSPKVKSATSQEPPGSGTTSPRRDHDNCERDIAKSSDVVKKLVEDRIEEPLAFSDTKSHRKYKKGINDSENNITSLLEPLSSHFHQSEQHDEGEKIVTKKPKAGKMPDSSIDVGQRKPSKKHHFTQTVPQDSTITEDQFHTNELKLQHNAEVPISPKRVTPNATPRPSTPKTAALNAEQVSHKKPTKQSVEETPINPACISPKRHKVTTTSQDTPRRNLICDQAQSVAPACPTNSTVVESVQVSLPSVFPIASPQSPPPDKVAAHDGFFVEIDNEMEPYFIDSFTDNIGVYPGVCLCTTNSLPGIDSSSGHAQQLVTMVQRVRFNSGKQPVTKLFNSAFREMFFALAEMVRPVSPCCIYRTNTTATIVNDFEVQFCITAMCISDTRDTSKNMSPNPMGEKIIISPTSFLPGMNVQSYLGYVNIHLIRETFSLGETDFGTFVHQFLCDALAVVRSHVNARGGNALLNYSLDVCSIKHSPQREQAYCLLSVSGDAVRCT
ncbi:hypothetical protein Pelo_4678 [Pelomyxa schiedti]|nr:hypothetical protein Pelo_4678 [Pelomyxa schiedti]